jgi:hypothetical protein
MNYNRYLDLHLCSYKWDIKHPSFTHRGTTYRYDFLPDMRKQLTYRVGKNEGYDPGEGFSKGNMRIFTDEQLTKSENKLFRLDKAGNISEELSQVRYVSCLVAIEALNATHVHYQIKALVKWISDPCTTNKLRVNCHGSGKTGGEKSGFLMGAEISPENFVSALVRHGLKREDKTVQNLEGLAHNARWKRDSEISACEKCKNEFRAKWYGVSTKHHCRRCGGIFCDNCSRFKIDLDKALVGESNRTARVSKARVCQRCFDEVMAVKSPRFRIEGTAARPTPSFDRPERWAEGSESKYGLQQITLALCMGAKGEGDDFGSGFSQEHGRGAIADAAHDGFVVGSLAQRLLQALRNNGLKGIKVTASNQKVAASGAGDITNSLAIKYPSTSISKKTLNYRYGATFDFPAKVWGSSITFEKEFFLQQKKHYCIEPDITLYRDNRSLEFGRAGEMGEGQPFLDDLLKKWDFSGWNSRLITVFSAPSSNALGYRTKLLTPPPRIQKVEIKAGPNNKQRVFLTGRGGTESFKDYKSYGVS